MSSHKDLLGVLGHFLGRRDSSKLLVAAVLGGASVMAYQKSPTVRYAVLKMLESKAPATAKEEAK